jgi:hypothetical protein
LTIIQAAADRKSNMKKVRFFILFLLMAFRLMGHEKIPLLISEHHADHMEFFFRCGGNTSAAMIVLDAHADTVVNEQSKLIQSLAAAGNFSRAGEYAGNHNWIHPLSPVPLSSLTWISTISGAPRKDKQEGFLKTTTAWDSAVKFAFSSIDKLRFLIIDGETLFISVDLDFFYSEDHRPEDVPSVLNALFNFSSRWQGSVAWAICLSRPWLPDDRYAWILLEKTLYWLCSRPEFNVPEITLFNSRRIDTSRTAEALRAEGKEIPSLREIDVPEHIDALFRTLHERD